MSTDLIDDYQTELGVYPSNTEVWFAAKDSEGNFDPSLIGDIHFGNTRAPNGHYILNAFDKDRATTSGISGVDSVSPASTRPNTVSFAFGRVWWGGAEESGTSGSVYFSQLLKENTDKAGRCYQENDPTAEYRSALLDTDGGVIPIDGANKIHGMEPLGQHLVVLTDVGVWAISGTTTAGFTASGYSVNKVLSDNILSGFNMVNAQGSIYFLSKNNVYRLTQTENGLLAPQDLSTGRINEFYSGLTSQQIDYSNGTYDPTSKRVIWFYPDDPGNADDRFKYVNALIYDTKIDAFLPPYDIKELSTDSPFVVGAFPSSPQTADTVSEDVTVNGATVTVDSEDVTVDVRVPSNQHINTKMFTVVPNGADNNKLTVSSFTNSDFLDWETADGTGIDADAKVVTGDDTVGVPSQEKYGVTLTAYFEITESGFELDANNNVAFSDPSGCQMRSRWDWANSGAHGKYSSFYQIYRLPRHYIPEDENDTFDYGLENIATKTRLKGRGKSLSLEFTSESGKDFKLLGFDLRYKVNTDA